MVVGIGVVANDELAREAGLAVGGAGGVVVDEHGRTADPWVSAAGDVAVRPSPWLPAPTRIEHWNSAQSHGTAVGASCAGVPTADDALPYFWSDQYGLTLQVFGRHRAGDEVILRDGAEPTGFVAFWRDSDGRVTAVAGIGAPREVRAGRALIESGVPVPAEALRDPDSDLRRLARAAAR